MDINNNILIITYYLNLGKLDRMFDDHWKKLKKMKLYYIQYGNLLKQHILHSLNQKLMGVAHMSNQQLRIYDHDKYDIFSQ